MTDKATVKFTRTTTTNCSDDIVTEDRITAWLGVLVIAELQWSHQPAKYKINEWLIHWKSHPVTAEDTERVLNKLKELRKEDDELYE